MNLETEELAQGSVVGGYRVVRTLGAGGMSPATSRSCASASWPKGAFSPGSSLRVSCVCTTSLNRPPANRVT